MSAKSNAPIIIKKVKKSGGDAHHGGAWKVAYADFVTAMMAFFMLMWLLNATTEKQRKGIADYFSPTIPLSRISGGGDGAFGGDSVFIEETLAHTGHGGVPSELQSGGEIGSGGEAEAETRALEEVEQMLSGTGGESMVSDLTARHIVTEVTDEGLIVQIYALKDEPLFLPDSTEPLPLLEELVSVVAQMFNLTTNPVAVDGYVASRPVVVAQDPAWELSSGRANRVRLMLAEKGLDAKRVARVTGHADRKPFARNPMAPRNNRLELILLRTKR